MAGRKTIVFDGEGRRISECEAGTGATAVTRSENHLILGFPEGSIELYSLGAECAREKVTFEGVEPSPVVTIMEGPTGTVVAGFANGAFGIWSTESGAPLYREQLHGPVTHLLMENERLHVATELGWHTTLDLHVFYRDYCDLLREVWTEIPVVWEEGRTVVRGSPAVDEHDCAL